MEGFGPRSAPLFPPAEGLRGTASGLFTSPGQDSDGDPRNSVARAGALLPLPHQAAGFILALADSFARPGASGREHTSAGQVRQLAGGRAAALRKPGGRNACAAVACSGFCSRPAIDTQRPRDRFRWRKALIFREVREIRRSNRLPPGNRPSRRRDAGPPLQDTTQVLRTAGSCLEALLAGEGTARLVRGIGSPEIALHEASDVWTPLNRTSRAERVGR